MREGTRFSDNRIIRGICERCADSGVLLYSHESDDMLMCASCSRERAKLNPRKQACDCCGSTGNVWRDPTHRRNEYLCIKCHDPEHLFQNRWADFPRQSKALGLREKVECAVKDGNCRGEVRWRSGAKESLCNRHAGKEGVGPNG